MLIDTHCHVSFEAYKGDVEDVVKRALTEHVMMITVGTRLETSMKAVKFAEDHEGVWATVGLHPGHVHAQDFVDENEVPADAVAAGHKAEAFNPEMYRTMLAHPKVVAVGECGLDYYRLPPGVSAEKMKEDQKIACAAQLKLASETGKPVVIHCRDAHADQAELLRVEIASGGLSRRGVIHCFTGTAAEAAVYKELGFYVAFGGIATFAKNVMETVKAVPLEQIILETDAPYLAPVPMRGKRNEPVYLRHIATAVAKLKGVDESEIERVTTMNAEKLFGIKL